MAAPPITERHKHHFHRQAPIKEVCRVATTANITISTALNNGDSIDGITLATGDRVLVKNQSTASQNGIYTVGASPARDYDLSTDDPGYGFIVLVLQGTTNAGTLWQNTNTTTPTIGSTSITFAAVSGSSGVPAGPITTSGLTMATARLLGRTTASTGAVEEITVGTGLSLSAGSLTATGGAATITTKDEGSTLSSTVTTLDFTGAGVTASGSGATTTVNIPGGGTSVTVQYPSLKPGTPTDDFAGASLGGGWSAHSNQGSFTTSHCMTQGEDWIGSALEMQFSAQNGTIYQTHGNTDLDFTIGGLRIKGMSGDHNALTYMVGIAALNSSGTGVGVVMYHNDATMYFATITTYGYASFSDSWAAYGPGEFADAHGDWWLRLKRVSGTWTGYVSKSGRAWDKTFSTRADSITVAQLHVGIFYNPATSYSGRVIADYYQLDA